MALQAYECACELKTRAQPDSFAVTGVHVCTCTHRNHAACIRRYFACANDSAGVRMRNRTHNACAARFRTVVVTLVSRVVSKMCAMANMVLILSCSCRAILRRAQELSARAAGATACMRVRVWSHGAPAFASLSLHVLAHCRACAWRCTGECAVFAPPVCYYRRIICLAWILEYLAARHSACLCVSMRAFVYCL
jgi:hypothetical protein